jgi:hypothetical protein
MFLKKRHCLKSWSDGLTAETAPLSFCFNKQQYG